jgi:tetratricopeptide (TPR) repeat protein
MFERFVAEIVWLVDGLNCIRIYGRSGQDQDGLDLIGYQSTDLHVYQVRRIDKLTAAALRRAVTDFTDPAPSKRSKGKKPSRRVDAQRFVLVTACTVDDTAVEDELLELKRRFAGDLEIDLYDGQELFRKVNNRGSLIYGIFGPDWAKAVCGHEPPAKPTMPDGRALLNDPVEMLGFGELRSRAEELDAQDPATAAELFGQLSKALSDKGFAAYGRAWKARERDALRAAGDNAGAFAVAMDLLLDLYEAGRHIRSEVNLAGVLAESLNHAAGAAALVATALNEWPEQGYDLAPVLDALRTLAEANHDLAGRLTLAIAEQIVTDDDPADDFALLLDVATALVGRMSGQLRTRLECCIADLKVHGGADPVEVFADLTGQAHGGWLSEPIGALALRRAARALTFAGRSKEAIEAYRRAVIEAAHADHGGDTLDTRQDPMRSARSIGTRTRLLSGSDDAALATLDALVDDKLPDAHRMAHHWVRHERIGGSLLDEVIARKRYGEVFARANMPAQAVRQFVLAGARKEAAAAAHTTSEPLDLSRYLTARFPVWVHASAACGARKLDAAS